MGIGKKYQARIFIKSILKGVKNLSEIRLDLITKLVVNGLFIIKFLNKFEILKSPEFLRVKTENFGKKKKIILFRIKKNFVHRAVLFVSITKK